MPGPARRRRKLIFGVALLLLVLLLALLIALTGVLIPVFTPGIEFRTWRYEFPMRLVLSDVQLENRWIAISAARARIVPHGFLNPLCLGTEIRLQSITLSLPSFLQQFSKARHVFRDGTIRCCSFWGGQWMILEHWDSDTLAFKARWLRTAKDPLGHLQLKGHALKSELLDLWGKENSEPEKETVLIKMIPFQVELKQGLFELKIDEKTALKTSWYIMSQKELQDIKKEPLNPQ